MTLVLGADGRFVLTFSSPQGQQQAAGTYTANGASLVFNPAGGGSLPYSVRWVDPNTVVLAGPNNAGGRFVRQQPGGGPLLGFNLFERPK
jgi:hypothetical protein